VKTSKRDKPGGHIDIIYDVNDNGVQKPVTTTVVHMVNPKLGTMSVTGNRFVPNDVLLAAAGLKEGDELTADSLNAAGKRVMDAYGNGLKKHHKSASVAITIGQANAAKPGEVDIVWKLAVTDVKTIETGADTGGYGEQ